MFNYKKNKGFTLVELLVVISIIGILSSVVFASLSSARKRARDAIRKSDLAQIGKALEINYMKNGSYTTPENCSGDTSLGATGACVVNGVTNDWDSGSDLRDLITDGSLNALPKDPINSGVYYYHYEVWNADEAYYVGDPGAVGRPAGQAYQLCAQTLESTGAQYCIFKTN
jgi:prepilin-type N-terminal cleavage/methylation domain-containing protein